MQNPTLNSPVRTWLAHPSAGPVLRGLVAARGGTEASLAPALGLPLRQLIDLSAGQFPEDAIDLLTRAVESGEVPQGAPRAEPAAASGTAHTPDTGVELGTPETWAEQVAPGRFEGQTVVVTGAASGIGRAVASRIVREGGRVVGLDVSARELTATAAELGESLLPVSADVSAPETAEAVISAAGGRIDALANIAGVMDDDAAVHEVADALWERCFRINVDGPMRLMRAVVPGMLAAGSGRIVNVVSEAALRGSAAGAAYTASKHALVGLTRASAFQYGGTGVQVNAVAPGAVATGIARPESALYGSVQTGRMRVAIPRLAVAEELAASITFLLSRDAVNISGAILPSDGGWSAA